MADWASRWPHAVTLFTEGLRREALTGLLAQAGQAGGDGIKIVEQEEDGHSALQPCRRYPCVTTASPGM
jgi:hypothetical protein